MHLTPNFPPQVNHQIEAAINKIKAVVHLLPGVVIIHYLPDFKIAYMSPNGLKLLNLTLEQACALSSEEYHTRYFNIDDAEAYIPKIRALIEGNSDESITFFQQVRFANSSDWVWHMNSMKILIRDENGLPLLSFAMAFRVDPLQHVTNKVSRMLEENTFLRENYARFSGLGKREREVLRLQALGKSSPEIADELFIAVATVETHRKNIKQKLKVQSAFELAQYARAFDLI